MHLFGPGVESMTLQCDSTRLHRVLAEAGQTKLINLKLESEKKPRTVMVREVQREPRSGESLHVDFYQVKMAELIKVEVPIVLFGEAPALKLKENMLVQDLNTLTVECLPAEIPTSVEIDLSPLTETEEAVRVKDIELAEGVVILNEPEHVVVKISLRHIEKIEEPVLAAEEEVEGEEVEGEAPEGAAPPEEESEE